MDLTFEPGPVVRAPIRRRRADRCPARARAGARRALRAGGHPPGERRTCRGGAAVIGFAGAPLHASLCYLVGGRPSKEFGAARAFPYAQPESAQRLLTHPGRTPWRSTSTAQAGGRRQALMLFESWAGLLGPPEFARFALRRRAAPPRAAARRRAPHLLRQPGCIADGSGRDLDVDVVGVDWRMGLAEGPPDPRAAKAVQGNLDPAALFAPPENCKRHVDAVLTAGRGERRGTSSISATASGRRPTRMPSRAWSTTSHEHR